MGNVHGGEGLSFHDFALGKDESRLWVDVNYLRIGYEVAKWGYYALEDERSFLAELNIFHIFHDVIRKLTEEVRMNHFLLLCPSTYIFFPVVLQNLADYRNRQFLI